MKNISKIMNGVLVIKSKSFIDHIVAVAFSSSFLCVVLCAPIYLACLIASKV